MSSAQHVQSGHTRRVLARQAGVYALTCFALWPNPVFQVLHVESAAVLAAVSFFCAGIGSIVLIDQERRLGYILTRQLALLAVPWLLLTLSLLWAPNAGYALGLLFWLLFPPVSVCYAVAMAWFLTGTSLPMRKVILIATGLAVALLGTVYDIGFHPQFYTFNAVFGGVLGPIYDEELTITRGLFVARAVTLLWAALLMWAGFRIRGARGKGTTAVPGLVLSVLLLLSYAFAAELGLNTTPARIQSTLGTSLKTQHFDIHVDTSRVDEAELRLIAAAHEYRLEQLRARTGLAIPGRITSYLYPDADVRARLTGARETSVAPIWLRKPQVHLLLTNFDRAFAHELAHVASREIGLPVLRISPSVGLVEGWAEALEPPDGYPGAHEQVAAALVLADSLGLVGPSKLAASLSGSVSSLGFWTGRSAVSYTTMGSFVRFLLDTYGIEPFSHVYRGGSWSAAYGKPVEGLAGEWVALLAGFEPDVETLAWVGRRFTRPSLFERPSPHYIPRHIRLLRRGGSRLAEGDTLAALQLWERGLDRVPDSIGLLEAWSRLVLARGRPDLVANRLHAQLSHVESPILWVRYADALALMKRPHAAMTAYRQAAGLLEPFDRYTETRLDMRMILLKEPELLAMRYSGRPPEAFVDQTGTDPDVRLVRRLEWALALAGHQRREEAAEIWPDCREITAGRVAAFCHASRGELALLEGEFEAAAAFLMSAQEAYSNMGDPHGAAFLADRSDFVRRLMEWGGPGLVSSVNRP